MIKDLLKEGGLYSILTVLTRGVSLLLIPFYTTYFSTGEFGQLDILVLFSTLLIIIFSLQLNQGLARYVGDIETPKEEKISFASNAIMITIVVMFLITGTLFLFSSNFLTIVGYNDSIEVTDLNFCLLSVFFNTIYYIINVYIRFLRKKKLFSLLSFAHTLAIILITFYLVKYQNGGIKSIFIAGTIVSILSIIIQLIYMKNWLKFSISGEKIKLLLSFSAPLIFGAIAHVLLSFTDRLFIKEYFSLDEVGIYAVGFKFASVIGLITQGFSMAIAPIIYNQYKSEETKVQLSKITEGYFSIGLLFCAILTLFSKEILVLFTQPEYYEAHQYMPLFFISALFMGAIMFFPGLNLKKKSMLSSGVAVFSVLINIGLNFLLIEEYKLYGAAIATLISSVIYLIIYGIASNRFYQVRFKLMKIVAPLLVFSITYYLVFKFNFKIDLFNVILKSVISLVGFLYIYILTKKILKS